MATVKEVQDRSGGVDANGIFRRNYLVFDVDNETDAAAAINTFIQTAGDALLGIRKQNSIFTKEEGPFLWSGVATWQIAPRRDEQEETTVDDAGEKTFRMAFQRRRFYRSLETVQKKDTGGGSDVPDYKRSINVVDGRVEGVDVPSPVVTFSQTIIKPFSFVTKSYVDTLSDLIGTTNDDVWFGYAAERVFFLSAAGSIRGNDEYSLTFEFALGKHETGVDIGNGIIVDANAWDVVWTKTELIEQTAGSEKYTVEVPQYAYVERIFKKTDFNAIGLGTTG